MGRISRKVIGPNMEFSKKVIKTAVLKDPVRVEDPKTVAERREKEARDIVREAQETAEKIRAEAFERIRQERERAREEIDEWKREFEEERAKQLAEMKAEATREAEAKVRAEVEPRLREAVERFERLVRETEETLERVLEENRNDLVDLALRIAEKLVGKIAERDKRLVVRTAVRSIEVARERQEMVIRVHPEDVQLVREFEQELIERFDDVKKIEVCEDRRVDRGGVWIETPSGFVDGRIRSQLEEIFESVLPEEESPGESAKQGRTEIVDENKNTERGEE